MIKKALLLSLSIIHIIHTGQEARISFTIPAVCILVATTIFGSYYVYHAYKSFITRSLLIEHLHKTNEESSKNNHFKKFVTIFSPPPALLEILVPHEKTLYENSMLFNRMRNNVLAKDTDLSRIIISQRMNNYIQQKEYLHVNVPKKYIFLTGDIWMVIAERIDSKKDPHTITLLQMQEAIDIVENLGYSDFDDINLITDSRGILFFIDTEEKSFISPIGKYNWGIIEGSHLKDNDTEALCKEKYLNLMCFNNYLDKYKYIQEEAARQFLKNRIETLKNTYETSSVTYTKVTGRTDLDNSEIDSTALNKYIQLLIQQTLGIRAKPRTYFNNP